MLYVTVRLVSLRKNGNIFRGLTHNMLTSEQILHSQQTSSTKMFTDYFSFPQLVIKYDLLGS